jgi:hypothetical protein
MNIQPSLVRNALTIIAALSLAVCVTNRPAASAAKSAGVTTLVATSPNALAITGNLRLINGPERNPVVRQVVFANGRSLRLKHMAEGVYYVTPPANPVLLRGKRLCRKNIEFLAFAWGLRSIVSMEAYDGPMKNATHCGTFSYKEK